MELGNVALMDAVKQEKITVSSFCSQRGVNGEGGRMLIGLERRFGVCQSLSRGNALAALHRTKENLVPYRLYRKKVCNELYS